MKQANAAVRDGYHQHCLQAHLFTTLVNDLTLSEEALWTCIEGTRRRNIQQGERLALSYQLNKLSGEQAYQTLLSFYAIKKATPPSASYFQKICEHSDIWSAQRDGELMHLGVFMRDFPSRVRYMYGCYNPASTAEGTERGQISSVLFWRLMLHYKAHGYQAFDWGGADFQPDSPTYGITEFKRRFGGQVREEWDLLVAGAMLRPIWRGLRRKGAGEKGRKGAGEIG